MSDLLIIEVNENNWQRACRLSNYLLREGADIRWATEPFTALVADGTPRQLERGAFLIVDIAPVTEPMLAAAQKRYGVRAQAVTALEGFVGLALRQIRIALYGGGGAPFNHARIFTELGFQAAFISPQEIIAGELDDFDLLAVPGGGGLAMMGQLGPLGDGGCRLIKAWVQRGGMYIGSCAGAFDAAIAADSFLEACPQQRQMQMVNALIWNRGDTEWIGLESPGIGVIKSRNLKPDHPVMFGLPEFFHITHYNGPFFDTETAILPDASAASGLSAVAGAGEDFTHSEQFLRMSETCERETTILGRAAREGIFNIVSGYNGLGRVVLFGSHPEFGYNLAMDDWGLPGRMLANAAFWQAGHLRAARSGYISRESGAARAFPADSGLREIARACSAIGDAVEQLQDASREDAAWLSDDQAMAQFGLRGRQVWARGLADFAEVTARMREALERATRLIKNSERLLAAGDPKADARSRLLQETVRAFQEALHHRTPAEWRQDFGYEGILQMLERAEAMLRKAKEHSGLTFPASTNPYAYFDSSPYQLVVGSYLAANGIYLNSWQLLQARLLPIEEQIFAIECAGASETPLPI